MQIKFIIIFKFLQEDLLCNRGTSRRSTYCLILIKNAGLKDKKSVIAKNKNRSESFIFIVLAPVVRKVGNAIYRINHQPAESGVCFVYICPWDNVLSGG